MGPLYVLSAVFLVVRYDSPAGLVFYWTMNNVFALIKSLINERKNLRLPVIHLSTLKEKFSGLMNRPATGFAVFSSLIILFFFVIFLKFYPNGNESAFAKSASNIALVFGLFPLIYFTYFSLLKFKESKASKFAIAFLAATILFCFLNSI